jgi:beta-glucanase (GH16 family)
MLFMRFLSLFLIGILALTGCKEEPVAQLVLPSGLTVSVAKSESVEGLVSVQATASGANFYTFIFEENGELTEIEAVDGKATYQYTESGTYQIKGRAHATYEQYVESSQNVTIEITQEPDPIIIDGIPTTGYSTATSYPGYTLVWSEEFDGTTLSMSDWNYEIGTGSGGWGNNEKQYYRQENSFVSDGLFIIEAKNETFNNSQYTSTRVTTQGKQSFTYGRIDVRAALPYGKGMWPAIWMLGNSVSTEGWPKCGEIDIMEMVGGNVSGGDNTVHGTVHWDNNGTKADYSGSNKLSEGIFAQEFHVFSIIWDEQQIRWFRDDIQFHSIDITPAALSEFHEPFFFILNVAVGGNWPGNPDANTKFPQAMAVDYIRVFQ